MSLLLVVLLSAAVCLLAAAVQAVTGFGFALVAVPLLALGVGPVDAVVLATVVSLVLTALASVRERAHALGTTVRRMSLGGLLGMPVGLLALARLDESALRVVIAVVIGVLVVLLWRRVQLGAGVGAQWGAGVVSGALLTSTGMNGPPLVLTVQAMGVSPTVQRATLQRVFCAQDLVAVLAFVALGRVDATIVAMAVAGAAVIPVGWAAGDRVFARVPPARFSQVVLATLLVTAVVSVLTAL